MCSKDRPEEAKEAGGVMKTREDGNVVGRLGERASRSEQVIVDGEREGDVQVAFVNVERGRGESGDGAVRSVYPQSAVSLLAQKTTVDIHKSQKTRRRVSRSTTLYIGSPRRSSWRLIIWANRIASAKTRLAA